MTSVRVKYTGIALPVTVTTVNLFNTVKAFPGANALQNQGLRRFVLDLVCDQNGTLKWYKADAANLARSTNASDPTDTTGWLLLATQAVTGAANTATVVDIFLGEYAEFKIDFLVGAVTETVWVPDMTLSDSHAKLT